MVFEIVDFYTRNISPSWHEKNLRRQQRSDMSQSRQSQKALLHVLARQHDRVPMASGNVTRMVFAPVNVCTRNLGPFGPENGLRMIAAA